VIEATANRLVLITGASSGIGRAAVREFVRTGARVIGVARDRQRLEALAAELGGSSRMIALECDVTDAAGMARLAERVLAEIGLPDVIVANAGIGLDALFTETNDEALRSVFEVNVFGLARSVRPFLSGMLERGSGRILFVSSILGKRGTPHYSAYSASKFALHGMADALRAELWGSGVSVGLVCPSSTATEFQDRLTRKGPPQRRIRPRTHTAESVARLIVRMADSRRREVVIGVEAKLLALVDAVAPGFVDWFLARVLTRKS